MAQRKKKNGSTGQFTQNLGFVTAGSPVRQPDRRKQNTHSQLDNTRLLEIFTFSAVTLGNVFKVADYFERMRIHDTRMRIHDTRM